MSYIHDKWGQINEYKDGPSSVLYVRVRRFTASCAAVTLETNVHNLS